MCKKNHVQKQSETLKQNTEYGECVCVFAAKHPKPFIFGPFPQTHGVRMELWPENDIINTWWGKPSQLNIPTPPSSAETCDLHIW